MINKVILLGNLGADPEVRFMPNGDQITNLRLATTRRWKDKNGERKEESEWHRVVLFGGAAKVASEYTKKGSRIYIEGRIRTQQWEKDGEKRYTTEIVGENITLLDRKQDGDQSSPSSDNKPRSSQGSNQPAPSHDPYDFDDSDIPF